MSKLMSSLIMCKATIVVLSHTMMMVSGYDCNDPFVCASTTLIKNNIQCRGYFSCTDASLTNNKGSGALRCDASHACYKAIKINQTANDELRCNGIYSCAMTVEGIYNFRGSETTCYGDSSCFGNYIYNEPVELDCSGYRSCANSLIESAASDAIVYLDGYLSGENSIFESGNDARYYFRGYSSGKNASILCGLGRTCEIDCYGNACSELNNISCVVDPEAGAHTCTIEINCYSVIGNGIWCPDDYDIDYSASFIYPQEIDTIVEKYNTNYDASVCNESLNSVAINVGTRDEYRNQDIILSSTNGSICSTSYRGCQYIRGIILNNTGSLSYSYNYNGINSKPAIRCEASAACSRISGTIIGYENSSIYFTGSTSGLRSSILLNNENDVYCTAYRSCNGTNIYPVNNDSTIYGNNLYAWGELSVAYANVNNFAFNVYIFGFEAGYYSKLSNIKGSIFCLAAQSCYGSVIKNVNNGVYANGYEVLSFSAVSNISDLECYGYYCLRYSSINNVANDVVAAGYQCLIDASIDNVGTVNVDGNYGLEWTTISNVDSIVVNGTFGLTFADISNVTTSIVAAGSGVVQGATISGVQSIDLTGHYLVDFEEDEDQFCTIFSNLSNNNISNNELTINITSLSDYCPDCGGRFYIYCTQQDICTINCLTDYCNPIILYCYGKCFYNGNFDYVTVVYSQAPSTAPTDSPSQPPTKSPTLYPTTSPTLPPTKTPSSFPTVSPTLIPTQAPSVTPTIVPTTSPSTGPTHQPTQPPTTVPSKTPTDTPSKHPSFSPTIYPTNNPTSTPSAAPTMAPSLPPTQAPSQPPTKNPTKTPSMSPTSAPTNLECDDSVQSRDSFIVCNMLLSLDTIPDIFYDPHYLRDTNYCEISDYFRCDDDYRITHILLNNSNIRAANFSNNAIDLNGIMFDYLASLAKLEYLDVSGNKDLVGMISDWSALSKIETVILSNSSFYGTVDIEQLSGMSGNHNKNGTSAVAELRIDNNNWDVQTLDWEYFDSIPNIKVIDISNNLFGGAIDLGYIGAQLEYFKVSNNLFTSMKNFEDGLETFVELKEFYIDNNSIAEEFDVSWLPSGLVSLDCSENSLFGDISVNNIPTSVVSFVCGYNDFGALSWDYSVYDEYNLQEINLINAKLTNKFDMKVFDNNGEFTKLEKIILSNNIGINISINFEYLQSTQINYFDIRNTSHYGSADFQYLTDNIYILMDQTVRCVDRYCSGDASGKIVSWDRENDVCVGSDGCGETCYCVTAYFAGLESYVEATWFSSAELGLVMIVTSLLGLIFLAKCYETGLLLCKDTKYCKMRDDLQIVACVGFVFQLWDFWSDLLLNQNMYDHFLKESVDSPDREDFRMYFIASLIFISVPWIVNLIFLLIAKLQWSGNIDKQAERMNLDALSQSYEKAGKWLSTKSKFLVLTCMISGSVVASLKLVNCRLFGMVLFDMGLPKFKQEEFVRHQLWLTVLLENVPQIIIAISYASFLNEFDNTIVLFALTSSTISVMLAIWSAFLQYPKKFYIFQMNVILNKSDKRIKRKIRKTNSMTATICDAFDQDFGFCFVENAFVINDKLFICNIVTSESNVFKNKLDKKQKLRLVEELNDNKTLKFQVRSVGWSHVDDQVITLVGCKKQKLKRDRQDAEADAAVMMTQIEQTYMKPMQQMGSMSNLSDRSQQSPQSPQTQQSPPSPFSDDIIINSDNDTNNEGNSKINNVGGINGNKGINTSKVAVPVETKVEDQETVIDELMTMSEGMGMGKSKTGGHLTNNFIYDKDNFNNWALWDCEQVSEWIENLLMNDTRFYDQSDIIDSFMHEFNNHRIDGQYILLFRKNEQEFKDFESRFKNNSYAIWKLLRKSIHSLKIPKNINQLEQIQMINEKQSSKITIGATSDDNQLHQIPIFQD